MSLDAEKVSVSVDDLYAAAIATGLAANPDNRTSWRRSIIGVVNQCASSEQLADQFFLQPDDCPWRGAVVHVSPENRRVSIQHFEDELSTLHELSSCSRTTVEKRGRRSFLLPSTEARALKRRNKDPAAEAPGAAQACGSAEEPADDAPPAPRPRLLRGHGEIELAWRARFFAGEHLGTGEHVKHGARVYAKTAHALYDAQAEAFRALVMKVRP